MMLKEAMERKKKDVCFGCEVCLFVGLIERRVVMMKNTKKKTAEKMFLTRGIIKI